jgi:hypothetical protein
MQIRSSKQHDIFFGFPLQIADAWHSEPAVFSINELPQRGFPGPTGSKAPSPAHSLTIFNLTITQLPPVGALNAADVREPLPDQPFDEHQ